MDLGQGKGGKATSLASRDHAMQDAGNRRGIQAKSPPIAVDGRAAAHLEPRGVLWERGDSIRNGSARLLRRCSPTARAVPWCWINPAGRFCRGVRLWVKLGAGIGQAPVSGSAPISSWARAAARKPMSPVQRATTPAPSNRSPGPAQKSAHLGHPQCRGLMNRRSIQAETPGRNLLRRARRSRRIVRRYL